jgi:glycerol-3-phosphate dehydrogenase
MPLDTHYDVIVVGAGIHGAGIAQLYALNGYSVLLIEQYSIGSQTSSRSSKLIHGGLRYLETLQFSLVRECLNERKRLLQCAPDLVRLVPFYIPVYADSKRSALTIRAGLSLYALLGNFRADARFNKLKQSEWGSLEGLSTNQLQAVYRYYDAQTDDLALTRAVVNSAIQHDACCVEQTRLLSAIYEYPNWHCVLQNGKGRSEVSAKVLINAAGAWVNQVNRLILPEMPRMAIDLVQGTHIELDVQLGDQIYYVESPTDKRAVFVMPWKERTLVGTTETNYQGNPAEVKPLASEENYLLSIFQHYFPGIPANRINSFAGLRVLPKDSNLSFNKPRDTRFSCYPAKNPVYVAVYGGKLTSYRITALKVFRQTRTTLGFSQSFVDSASVLLQPD